MIWPIRNENIYILVRPAADKYPKEHDPHRGVRGDAAGRVPVGQSRRHLRAARHADRGHARQHGVRSGVRRQRGLRHLPRAQVHQRPRVRISTGTHSVHLRKTYFALLAFAFKQTAIIRRCTMPHVEAKFVCTY